jgi:hypothetical protein
MFRAFPIVPAQRTLLVALILSASLVASAQSDLTAYLQTHAYAFSLRDGFQGPLRDTLTRRLAAYRLILQAEGGSHGLDFYNQLQAAWVKFLHEKLGVTCLFEECGTSVAVLCNRFLRLGDSSLVGYRQRIFFDSLYRYNATLPPGERLYCAGVDFEWQSTYIRGLKVLLPDAPAPAAIRRAIDRIRAAPDKGFTCEDALVFNRKLKRSLNDADAEYRGYLGANYADFDRIVRNNGGCDDVTRDRNGHLAANILARDREIGAAHYFAEFGEGHTILKNRNVLAGILSRSEAFREKVAVINLYCYDCTTPEIYTSNWPLFDVEVDIQRYFLPFCAGDFTFFDLSGDDPAIARFKAYGQFLIVAKRQQ